MATKNQWTHIILWQTNDRQTGLKDRKIFEICICQELHVVSITILSLRRASSRRYSFQELHRTISVRRKREASLLGLTRETKSVFLTRKTKNLMTSLLSAYAALTRKSVVLRASPVLNFRVVHDETDSVVRHHHMLLSFHSLDRLFVDRCL